MKNNFIDLIIDYESGILSDKKMLELFSYLIKSGQAWTLQGHYGRTASALIDNDLISKNGQINSKKVAELGL